MFCRGASRRCEVCERIPEPTYIGESDMEYIIAVYRSRSVAIRAYNFLLQNGVTCALVSTPRSANVGCGLSVKFGREVLAHFRPALASGETFVGFFVVKNTLHGSTVARI